MISLADTSGCTLGSGKYDEMKGKVRALLLLFCLLEENQNMTPHSAKDK